MAMLNFGEYTPDLPDLDSRGVTVAKNVLPFGNAYKSFPSATVYSDALDNPCLGAIAVRDSDAVVYNYAGDTSKLYSMNSGVWSDVSKSGGYSTAADDKWKFTKWGNKLLAVNYADNPQSITLGGANFADLTTDFKARHIAVVRDFVVVGNTNDSTDGNVANRVRWSAINDETSWTVSAATQADYQDIQGEQGWVQAIVGGEYGIVFCERSIYRMTYVGSPIVFQFDEVERGRGTPASNSVVKFGQGVGYLGIDGFYIFNGQSSIAIGVHKVDRFFWDDVDQNFMYNIFGAHDPENQLLMWAYPNADATAGRPNRVLVYNYSPNAMMRWSLIDEQDISFFYRSFGEGYTLDGLDSVSTDIDTGFSVSFDSRVWTGNTNLLSGFNGDNKQVNFDGAALDATLETQELQLTNGGKTLVNTVRPIIDGAATLTMQVGERNIQSDSVTWGPSTATNSNGNCAVRSSARYHRARVSTSGAFDFAQGVEVLKASARGSR